MLEPILTPHAAVWNGARTHVCHSLGHVAGRKNGSSYMILGLGHEQLPIAAACGLSVRV